MCLARNQIQTPHDLGDAAAVAAVFLEQAGKVFAFNLETAVERARQCLDRRARQPLVDWLIKWNLRTTNVKTLAERLEAEPATVCEHPRVDMAVVRRTVARL